VSLPRTYLPAACSSRRISMSSNSNGVDPENSCAMSRSEAKAPRGASAVLQVSGAPGEVTFPLADRTPVSFVVRVPRGVSHLTLTADLWTPGGQIKVSAPRVRRASGIPVVRAESTSPDPGF